jgi:hypothetical protein
LLGSPLCRALPDVKNEKFLRICVPHKIVDLLDEFSLENGPTFLDYSKRFNQGPVKKWGRKKVSPHRQIHAHFSFKEYNAYKCFFTEENKLTIENF